MVTVRQSIIASLEQATQEKITNDLLKTSPVADFGCPIAFEIAKKQGRDPKEVAEEIVGRLSQDPMIDKAFTSGAYVNIRIKKERLVDNVLLPKSEHIVKRGRIILEHTSANPTGPLHVGRIRGALIGDSMRRILTHVGYEVNTRYFVNDVGKQVAQIACALEDDMPTDPELEKRYDANKVRGDYRVFFTYVAATKAYERDEDFRQKVTKLIQAAESGDKDSLSKITDSARFGLSGQKKTYEMLGIIFDDFDFESEGLQDGSVDDVIKTIRSHPLYVKEDIGEGLDLSGFGIEKRTGMTVCARSDGTSVYISRDLAYHLKKIRLGDRIINILGEDHKLQFLELKTILEQVFGVKKKLEVVHFSFVNFAGAKFSTRRGEIATVDELISDAIEKAQKEVEKRDIAGDDSAESIGVGAIKFSIVKTTPNKQINFSFEDALNFDGETAPYIQYSHARSCRILEKAGYTRDTQLEFGYADIQQEEKNLLLKMSELDDVLEKSAAELRPDILASYLIELSQEYGRFYMNCPVLDAPEKTKNRRILTVKKLADTIKTGLGLLGINAPQRM